MTYQLTEADCQLLRRMQKRIWKSNSGMMNAVYTTPAQQLRNRADEIEAEEYDNQLFNNLIEKL